MWSTLRQSRRLQPLTDLNAYGVQALGEAEATATNGGFVPLLAVLLAADVALISAMVGAYVALAISEKGDSDFCPAN